MNAIVPASDFELAKTLPKLTIGQFRTLLEDTFLSASAIVDGKLVMRPITLDLTQYDGMARLTIFLQQLEHHKTEVGKLLSGRGGRR